jgi:hypothetical protein
MADEWVLDEEGKVPPPLFTQESERDFVKQVGDEISEQIAGQFLLYLAVDYENTKFHDVYGESLRKTFFPPVKIHVPVRWEGMITQAELFGLDKRPKITVYFPARRVRNDLELQVREGDFVKYGRDIFEIVSLNEDTPLFGSDQFQVQIVANCVKARPDAVDCRFPDFDKDEGS